VSKGLTHLDSAGNARMVDVGDKASTERRAVARAVVRVTFSISVTEFCRRLPSIM